MKLKKTILKKKNSFLFFVHTNTGDIMTDMTRYNIFIFFSSFARNIIEIFSAVFLYDKGFSIREIYIFYFVLYFSAIFVNIATIYLNTKIKSKYILIVSSFLYCYTYYFMSVMDRDIVSLIIFACLLSISSFSYHALRHYFAINSITKEKNKDIGNILIYTYLAITPASLIGAYITKKFNIMVTSIIMLIILILAILPILNFKNNKEKVKQLNIKTISKGRIIFFILEQFKVLFLVMFPLYLYLNIDKSTMYIGLVNLFICLASVIFTFLFSRLKDNYKYFWVCNILFCLVLILKINITSKILLIMISFFEGIGIKMYEIISTENMYNIKDNDINKYLIFIEVIFCLTRAVACLIFLFIDNLKISLYIMVICIFLSGFCLKKNTTLKYE